MLSMIVPSNSHIYWEHVPSSPLFATPRRLDLALASVTLDMGNGVLSVEHTPSREASPLTMARKCLRGHPGEA